MRAIDIETIPNPDMVDSLPEPTVAYGNAKDPEKRAAKLAEAKVAQVDKMALNPLYGKVCAAGICGDGFSDSFSTTDEPGLIKWIFDHVGERICTWNGNGFDLPFLYKRALLLSVPAPCSLGKWTKRYSYDKHCDLMQIWAQWNYGSNESLDAVSAVVNGQHKAEYNYKDFPEMMKTEEGQAKIAAHALEHAELTLKLYNRMSGYLI